jgi:GNAT superfamily N-acetyltransferase
VAPEDFGIREAGLDDLEVALGLADLIFRFQHEPPTWTGTTPPSLGMLREDWREFLAEEKGAYFLAERDGQPLGHLGLVAHDDETIDLAIAATRSEARGTGVGVALTEHALHWAYTRGFGTCTTDWRSANLLSSRFWPRRGFVPTAYRFFRLVTP